MRSEENKEGGLAFGLEAANLFTQQLDASADFLRCHLSLAREGADLCEFGIDFSLGGERERPLLIASVESCIGPVKFGLSSAEGFLGVFFGPALLGFTDRLARVGDTRTGLALIEIEGGS